MAYAGDRFYNEVIRRQMGDLATKVKVREIIAHLYCLTISDREEIEAKRDTVGNYSAMMVLLDNLRRRENWPDLFVKALRKCEHWALADELGEAYDRIRGIQKKREDTTATSAPVPPLPAATAAVASVSHAEPPAPALTPATIDAAPNPAIAPAEASATVITATIHNVPHSTTSLLTPAVEASALSATPSINSPLGPSINIGASASVIAPALVSAPDSPVHSPSNSVHSAEQPSVVAPDARPPSLVSAPTLIPSTGQSEVPVDSREAHKLGTSAASASINSLQESGSNIVSPGLTEARALDSTIEASVQVPQTVALQLLAPHAMPPSPVSAPKVVTVEQSEIPVSSRVTPPQGISGGQTNTALFGPSPIVAPTLATNITSTSSWVNKAATTSQASASPEKSSFVNHPVQETNTPGTVLPQDLQNNPTNSQVVEKVHTAVSPNYQTQEISQGAALASSSASTGAAAGCFSIFAAENNENFSKPGVLGEEEPFSGSSDCLQISHTTIQEARPQAVSNPHGAEEHVNVSVSVTTDDLMLSSSTMAVLSERVSDAIVPFQNSTSRSLENGIPEGDNNSHPNQPVEDFYESDIRVHIGEVSENPAIQNLSGQPPSIVRQITIGLSHNDDTDSLVQSVSQDQPSQHTQDISQCIKGSNTGEQAVPATGLKPYTMTAEATNQKSEINASGQINIPKSEQIENSKGILHQFKSNAHLIAASAIGMIAIYVALKHK